MEEYGEKARIVVTETRKDDQHDSHLKEYKDYVEALDPFKASSVPDK